jgi:hypothetical protein
MKKEKRGEHTTLPMRSGGSMSVCLAAEGILHTKLNNSNKNIKIYKK